MSTAQDQIKSMTHLSGCIRALSALMLHQVQLHAVIEVTCANVAQDLVCAELHQCSLMNVPAESTICNVMSFVRQHV